MILRPIAPIHALRVLAAGLLASVLLAPAPSLAARHCPLFCNNDAGLSSCMAACEAENREFWNQQSQGGSAPRAPARYGALALSSDGSKVGGSQGFGSRAQAEQAALFQCSTSGGGRDCRVVTWFQNTCGAVAAATGGAHGWYGGDSVRGASARALAYCRSQGGKDCKVVRTACA